MYVQYINQNTNNVVILYPNFEKFTKEYIGRDAYNSEAAT